MEEIELPKAQQGLTVGPDEMLIIRLNPDVSAEQARQFRDLAVKQGQQAGVRILVVVADELASAAVSNDMPVIGYRIGGQLHHPADVTVVRRWEFDEAEMAAEMDRHGPDDLGDDPDGDNTPGMGDH